MSLQRQLELRDRVIQHQNILLGNAHIPIPEIEPIATTSLTSTQQLPILKPSFSAHALLSSSKSDEEPLSLPDVDGKVKKRIIPTNITPHHKSARSHATSTPIHKTSGRTSPAAQLSRSRSRTEDMTIPPSKQKTRAVMRGVTSLHSSSSSSLLPSSQSQSHSRSSSHTDHIPIHHSKSATATPTITSPPDSPHQSRLHHKLLTHAQHKQNIIKPRIPTQSTTESRPISQHKHTKSASVSTSSSTVASASASRVATPREPLIDTLPQPPHMDADSSDDSWDEDFESADTHVGTTPIRQTPVQAIISPPTQTHSHTHPKSQTKIKPKPKRAPAKKPSKEGRHSRAKKKQLQAAYGLPVL